VEETAVLQDLNTYIASPGATKKTSRSEEMGSEPRANSKTLVETLGAERDPDRTLRRPTTRGV